jgi:hypothetical protein
VVLIASCGREVEWLAAGDDDLDDVAYVARQAEEGAEIIAAPVRLYARLTILPSSPPPLNYIPKAAPESNILFVAEIPPNIALTPAAVSAIINLSRRARLTVWQRI